MLFNLNEITTDHAVVGWGDPGLPDLHGMYWSSSNDFTEAMYYRLAQAVSFSNSFIKNASELSGDEVSVFVAEARFLRAFAYFNLLDLYGNVPLTTEISTELPTQSNRTELFNFIESELMEIESILLASNEYGRVDNIAAHALLSRLYLNAEVWTGQGARWRQPPLRPTEHQKPSHLSSRSSCLGTLTCTNFNHAAQPRTPSKHS